MAKRKQSSAVSGSGAKKQKTKASTSAAKAKAKKVKPRLSRQSTLFAATRDVEDHGGVTLRPHHRTDERYQGGSSSAKAATPASSSRKKAVKPSASKAARVPKRSARKVKSTATAAAPRRGTPPKKEEEEEAPAVSIVRTKRSAWRTLALAVLITVAPIYVYTTVQLMTLSHWSKPAPLFFTICGTLIFAVLARSRTAVAVMLATLLALFLLTAQAHACVDHYERGWLCLSEPHEQRLEALLASLRTLLQSLLAERGATGGGGGGGLTLHASDAHLGGGGVSIVAGGGGGGLKLSETSVHVAGGGGVDIHV